MCHTKSEKTMKFQVFFGKKSTKIVLKGVGKSLDTS